jgi:hypothetical protein
LLTTEIPDIYGTGFVGGSGDDLYSGSGAHYLGGSGGGSGHIGTSGDGSDGDDEDFYPPKPSGNQGNRNNYKPTQVEGSGDHHHHNHNNHGKGRNKPTFVPDRGDPVYSVGRVTSSPPPSKRPRKPANGGLAPSVSWWCLSLVLVIVKSVQIITS